MGQTRIRALVLDYGGVISKPQNPDNVNNMLQILSQDDNDFRNVYLSKRENYDNGQLSGEEYWLGILEHFKSFFQFWQEFNKNFRLSQ